MTPKPTPQVPVEKQKYLRQHAKLAMGLPVNKPVPNKMPKTPA